MWQDFLALLLAFLLLFTGVSTPAVSGPVTPPAAETGAAVLPMPGPQSVDPYLLAALSFAPLETELLSFTDWEAIKLRQHAGGVTGASPMGLRRDFLRSLTEDETAASAFALAYFAHQAEQWGWDTTDLLWEATVQGQGAPVFVLRLRDDFDMEGLLARFEERDFTKTKHSGALVYTHPLDLTVPWRTELAVFNAAVLPDEKILIHASDPTTILSVLAARAGAANWQNNAAALAVAAALGPASAALIAPGPQTCADLGFAALLSPLLGSSQSSADELAALQQKFFGDKPLHPYLMLGVGYRYEASHPVGMVVMHYPSPDQAQTDLEARQELAANGQSISTQAPFRDLLFSDAGVAVSSDNLVLSGRLADDRPQRLFNMFYRRDMPFAACS